MNVAEVRSVLAEGLPGQHAGTVTLLGEGEDNRVFDVDGVLVVRFALVPDPAAIDREARLLKAVAAVAAVVPVPVPVPAFVLAERGCLAYRKLPGIPLLDLPQRRRHTAPLTAQLSGLLAVLHAIPPESMAGLAVVDDQPMAEWLAEAAAFHPAVAGSGGHLSSAGMTGGLANYPTVASSTRRLIWGLFCYAGWYVLCAVAALGRAAYLRGEPYLSSRNDIYTQPVDVWPGALQPVGRLLLCTAAVGHLVAMPAAVWAAVRLTDPEVRASRVTWTWLLIGALLVAGTVVLGFSGPGATVRTWIMD